MVNFVGTKISGVQFYSVDENSIVYPWEKYFNEGGEITSDLFLCLLRDL